jgi:hypothetical protein
MNLLRDPGEAYTQPMLSHLNVGTGMDCTIREQAETAARVTGFRGRLVWDASTPNGAPRKLMDMSRLAALCWKASITLEEGAARHLCLVARAESSHGERNCCEIALDHDTLVKLLLHLLSAATPHGLAFLGR